MTRHFLPFVATTSDPSLLRWTGRFGPEFEFRNGHVVFFDAVNPGGTLSAFVKTANVPNCPSYVQSRTLVWHILVCGLHKQQNFFSFVDWPFLWQRCPIMWQCTRGRERW